MDNLLATGVEDEDDVLSDEDDDHFLGGQFDPSSFSTMGIKKDTSEDKPCDGPSDISSPQAPCDPKEVEERVIKAATSGARKSGVDYKGIWLNSNMPCVIAQLNSGKLLKGNTFFMKFVFFL